MLGTTKIYGCLADPIDHVKAPTIFTSIFKEKNIDGALIGGASLDADIFSDIIEIYSRHKEK